MTRALLASTVVVALLVGAVPAQAGQRTGLRARAMQTDRAAAERSLSRAKRVAHGRGVGAGRELTGALRAVAVRMRALGPAARDEAKGLLARPTDNMDSAPGGPYTTQQVQSDCSSANFCVHWVETTEDAPSLTDAAPANSRPDYIDLIITTFETTRAVENGTLGWSLPEPDASLGGDGKTDVYVKDVGKLGAYGYSAMDPGQSGPRRYAYLVVDDDYAAEEFPAYGGDSAPPLQATAAHEYNHVLQFGYDFNADGWMFESTATWAEEKVFSAVNDFHHYMKSWAALSTTPITTFDNSKVYGSAIWNHWLDGRFGAAVVRRAWEVSAAASSFAPGAYDRAIREAGGGGFADEFIDFAASTAEWDAPNSGIYEGAAFPSDMERVDSLPIGGERGPISLNHTGYALLDVAASRAPALELTGSLPPGTVGAVGLIGFDGNISKAVAKLPASGQASVTLPDPGRFSRITAVGVNADTSQTGFDGSDWTWSRDDQALLVAVKETDASPGAIPTPALRLGFRRLPRLARLARTGVLLITARVSGPGRLVAKATVDKATAKRLKVGRKTTRVGAGARRVGKAGKKVLKVRITRKARAAFKRRPRKLRMLITATFTPAGGGQAVTKRLSLLLKP